MFRRQPIARQIVALVTAAVLATAAVMIAITFNGPPPKAPPVQLDDVAAALRGEPAGLWGHERLHRRTAPTAPSPGAEMRRDMALEAQLAARLGRDPGAVRAYVGGEPPRGPPPGMERPGPPHFFAGEGRFGWHRDGRWLQVDLDPAPISVPWWVTVAASTAVLLGAIVGLAWRSARAITRPLDRLAARVHGGGSEGASAADDGAPPEIALVAGALSAFQRAQSDQVVQRTRMLSAIAHDMGTPLARLAFRLEALPDAQREAAHRDIAAMRRLIADSLALDRSGSEAAERFDLGELAGAMVDECRALDQPVSLTASMPAAVLASSLGLRRLIQNLIENALRYGGSAELSVARRDGMAELAVRDHGPGFSDAMLIQGCEPFVRGEASRNPETGGSGLGLAIASAIAAQHKGTLNLRNRPAGGGEVLLRLPLA